MYRVVRGGNVLDVETWDTLYIYTRSHRRAAFHFNARSPASTTFQHAGKLEADNLNGLHTNAHNKLHLMLNKAFCIMLLEVVGLSNAYRLPN